MSLSHMIRSADVSAQALLLCQEVIALAGEPERCGALLDAFPQDTPLWHLLRGEAYFAQGEYQKAAPHYHRAEEAYPNRVYSRLEVCYREQEDYKMAYQYACRQRK